MARERRAKVFRIRCSDEEYDMFERVCAKQGIPGRRYISTWAREVLIDAAKKIINPKKNPFSRPSS